MSKTYYASHHKPGCPVSLTLHTPEIEAAFKDRPAELGMTVQQFVDKISE